MAKKKCRATVLGQQKLAEGIYDLQLETDMVKEAKPGQFVMVFPENAANLLPRPISICEIIKEKNILRLVYRVAGKGTGEFSTLQTGDSVAIMGPLGNGYDLTKAEGKKVMLMGGGIGIPPMLELAKELGGSGILLGYRDANLFLKEDMEQYGDVYVATEDGSAGTKGNVCTIIEEKKLQPDMIMACGPMPMLRAIKHYAETTGIPAFISLEERMACGVGACLGCVCKTTKKDAHSHVNNARVCTDGPVFEAADVEI
ncbi:MAG: dihydroorotate dehydrogenase electron transfer subunit [Lachnospiraceae bacterium]|nr:dihydroorotate dehydrogenase electron transfer subunit [Lachnospiraceae bacterium]